LEALFLNGHVVIVMYACTTKKENVKHRYFNPTLTYFPWSN